MSAAELARQLDVPTNQSAGHSGWRARSPPIPRISGNTARFSAISPPDRTDGGALEVLVRFCHLVSGGIFTTRELHPEILKARAATPETYKLRSLRYDLSKLRAKGMVEKLPHSNRCRLPTHGYQVCLLFLKLFHRIYAALTAGILDPFPRDRIVSIN